MFILFLTRCIIMMRAASYFAQVFFFFSSSFLVAPFQTREDTSLPDVSSGFFSARTKRSVGHWVVANLSFSLPLAPHSAAPESVTHASVYGH